MFWICKNSTILHIKAEYSSNNRKNPCTLFARIVFCFFLSTMLVGHWKQEPVEVFAQTYGSMTKFSCTWLQTYVRVLSCTWFCWFPLGKVDYSSRHWSSVSVCFLPGLYDA